MCPYDIGRDKSRSYKLFLNSSNPQILITKPLRTNRNNPL